MVRVSHAPRLIPAHAGKTLEAVCLHGFGPAHPRSRGENGGSSTPCGQLPGSSPLTRGKHAECPASGVGDGLIPAHAGKTAITWIAQLITRAHPRSRGENLVDAHVRRGDHGSSPLTRGKLLNALAPLIPVRLIPAHAGKTVRDSRTRGYWEAHPRSRGENARSGPSSVSHVGSSPLTRGKRARRSP